MTLTAACFGRDVERDGWPSVSVIMPIRNEEAHLEAAVASVLAQEYPEPFEVCLAVGPSDDGTESVAAALAEREPRVIVVPNPAGVTPVALNTAVAATTGEVVVRVDGHAALSDGYIRRAVETMIRTGAVNVGGMQVPTPETPFEEAVAAATTSWLGTGGASYRVGGSEGPVDTVYLGVFDRAAGDAVGWFAPDLIRNQDYELNIRLRQSGGTVWFDPALSVGYRPRGSWKALAKQYYEYGYWKAKVLRRHPESIRLRQFIAAAGPVGLVASAVAGIVRPRLAAPALCYTVAVAGTAAAARGPARRTALIAAVFPCQQGAWSCGFFTGTLGEIARQVRAQCDPSDAVRAVSTLLRPTQRRHDLPTVGRPDAVATSPPPGPEVHLCDNYSHLLRATADLASRERVTERPLVLFIDDQLPLNEKLRQDLETVTGAELRHISDRGAVADFECLPRWIPGMLRRNVSWHDRRPVTAYRWTPAELRRSRFETAYVYHPGFFLSKVVAGISRRVVMRDSGYSNYVVHRVPWNRRLLRLVAGRPPRRQTWGEERWIDEIEVARPDQLPSHVRHKASGLTLDELMHRLPLASSRRIAEVFWGDVDIPVIDKSTALLLTQPIDRLGICSADDKRELYGSLASRLQALGYSVVIKPHPRETGPILPGQMHLPAAFPIEGWTWLGQPRFAAAISLNSAALADTAVGFAERHLQLVPPTAFYAEHWDTWPSLIDAAFTSWGGRKDDEPSTDPDGAISRPPGRAE